jgi:hypothetical protein
MEFVLDYREWTGDVAGSGDEVWHAVDDGTGGWGDSADVFGRWLMDASNPSLFDRVREALLMEWDPIGIQEFPEAHAEYDSYVPDLCELLMRKETWETVFAYLWHLEIGHMGLRGDQVRTQTFSERLIRIARESD